MKICRATLRCIINRTVMRQTGYGYEMFCPECGFIYNPEEKPKFKKEKSTEYKNIIKRKFSI